MVLIMAVLALVGAAMGSFAGALAWRLHAGRDFVTDRSECEHCHHKLGAWDLIPILSWIMLRGKCRYCHQPIGWQPLWLEVGTATVFAGSYLLWPYDLHTWQGQTLLAIWLVATVLLMALLAYDLRWMILPDRLIVVLVVLAAGYVAVRCTMLPPYDVVLDSLFGLLPITGVYGALYAMSKGNWVGFGDVKLGVFIGLVLGWQKALLVLMLANVIGFVLLVPGLLSGKVDRKSHIPFGPFLIIAFVIAGLFGDWFIHWFLNSALFMAY